MEQEEKVVQIIKNIQLTKDTTKSVGGTWTTCKILVKVKSFCKPDVQKADSVIMKNRYFANTHFISGLVCFQNILLYEDAWS